MSVCVCVFVCVCVSVFVCLCVHLPISVCVQTLKMNERLVQAATMRALIQQGNWKEVCWCW